MTEPAKINDPRGSTRQAARLFARRLAQSRPLLLAIAVATMVVGAVAANYPAILSGRIIDEVAVSRVASFYAVLPFLALLFGSYALREGAGIVRKLLIEQAACALERDELRRLSSFLLRLDLSAFLGQRIGGLNLRIHRSIEGLVKLLKLLFMDLAPTLLLSGVALVMVGARSLLVLAVMGGVFGLAMAVTGLQVATQRGIRWSLFDAKAEVSANLTEVLMALDYVRAAGGMTQEEARTASLSQQLFTQEFKHHRWMMSFDSLKQLLEGLGLVLVVGVGALEMVRGAMTGGEVLTLSLLYASAAAPLRDVHRIVDEGFENIMKVGELADLYDLPVDAGIPGVTPLPAVSSGPAVSARGLSLSIPTADGEEEILRGLSFDIAAGQWVGVAGESGSGKSTLAKVILGIAPRYRGSLSVQGVEVRTSLKSDFWRRVAYVGQTPHVIKGTLRENLLYGLGDDGIAEADLQAAVNQVGLAERFWGNGAAGLNAPIEEQGGNLSGGERQRLAVARLFLRQPSLIILDEATSGLDLDTEWRVIQALRRQFGSVTTIVVAHHLEALKETDHLLVLHDGALVEQGSFETLLSRGGEFSRITKLPQQKAA